MRYVSDERLRELLEEAKVRNFTVSSDAINGAIAAIETLLDRECKELPAPQWQTLEEFKGSGFVGLCWILDNDGDVFAHNYDGEYFTNPYMPNYPIHNNRIHSVQPIITPEAPE